MKSKNQINFLSIHHCHKKVEPENSKLKTPADAVGPISFPGEFDEADLLLRPRLEALQPKERHRVSTDDGDTRDTRNTRDAEWQLQQIQKVKL